MKRKFVFTVLFFAIGFFCHALLAAAPITHVVLAEMWIKHHEHYKDTEKRAFMLGNLFPDIRYLGVITRAETHERHLTLSNLFSKQTEFRKGMRLHAIIDETREQWVQQWKIYDRLKNVPGQRYKTTFLKLLEDEVLYARYNFVYVRNYLSRIDKEELQFGISYEAIKKWHRQQKMAMVLPPSVYLSILCAFNRNFGRIPPNIIAEWSKLLPKLAKDPNIQAYVDRMLAEFDKQFAKVQ